MKTKIFTLLLLLGLVGMATMIGSANAAPLLTIGSSSGDVWDLQYRLKTLDFYTEPLDGVYGSQTKAAVAKFQKAYGISADGISGTKTWNILKNTHLILMKWIFWLKLSTVSLAVSLMLDKLQWVQ